MDQDRASIKSSAEVPAEATHLVVDLTKGVFDQALLVLWKFVTEPMRDGTRWANWEEFRGPEDLRSSLVDQPRLFLDLSRMALRVGRISTREVEILKSAIGVLEASRLFEEHEDAPIFVHWGERRKADMAEQRLIRRHDASIMSYAKANGLRHRVQLQNLSESGAMIIGLFKMTEGQSVEVRVDEEIWKEGVVRWSLQDRCGVQFLSPG
ncbi:hypothetical protein GRI89_00105 [Altererythrobacter salegens]|uniref:PilZ domain-containing protein n=1 Tax=Croceibacterium salegens TaxID=1737568 RepID=A0A6I4SS65_9SPHN|nr:PilZ domain-containing protein [Croceibacterium salegens]MXO57950.1 hypothetical protein [Croceibacterium salegens]